MKNSTQTAEDIRIYVACLAAYNNGILHGHWIDATQSPEDIRDGINQMLKCSPIDDAEEWAIHDYDGFGTCYLSECEDIQTVSLLAMFIEEHGELGAELYSHFGDLECASKAMEDSYCGCYESIADYARYLTEDTTCIPDNLSHYIDYESMGRDMAICDVFTIETAHDEVHVFWQH